MRRLLPIAAAGLCLALWPAVSHAQPLTGKGTVKDILIKPADDGVCGGDFGTAVKFVKTPTDAAKQALKEEKLVLVLHVSGMFEDPQFT